MYGLNSLQFSHSSNITLRDLSLRAIPGMGLYTQEVTNIRLDNVRVDKLPGETETLAISLPLFYGFAELAEVVFCEGAASRRYLFCSHCSALLGRPMSVNADATHFDRCRGLVVMNNCWFEGQGDDGSNVHGHYQVQKLRSLKYDSCLCSARTLKLWSINAQ